MILEDQLAEDGSHGIMIDWKSDGHEGEESIARNYVEAFIQQIVDNAENATQLNRDGTPLVPTENDPNLN